MKQLYLIFLLITTLVHAQITSPLDPIGPSLPSNNLISKSEGNLEVSLSGAALYSIPIQVPSGINGIVPDLSLNYNSQSGIDRAGLGWGVSGVSVITRVGSTKFHDGAASTVAFNSNDRFSLDGQRLLLKSGVYGGDGAIYETEFYSNIKVSSHGVSPYGARFGPEYFKIEYPDGSVALYGKNAKSRSKLDFAITELKNASGITILYNYISSGDLLLISKILYVEKSMEVVLPFDAASSTSTSTSTSTITNTASSINRPVFPIQSFYQNEVNFIYEERMIPEVAYVGGDKFENTQILSEIEVKSEGKFYKKYKLEFNFTSLMLMRLIKISEFSGVELTPSTPITFSYPASEEYSFAPNIVLTNAPALVQASTHSAITGEFSGDGRLDYILKGTNDYTLFITQDDEKVVNNGINVSGFVRDIFPCTFLDNNQSFMPYEGWITTTGSTFTVNSLSSNNSIIQQYTKRHDFRTITIGSRFTQCNHEEVFDIPKRYLSGDFNGDGLTDILVVEEKFNYTYVTCRPGYPLDSHETATYLGGQIYLVDMDRNKSTNFITTNGILDNFDSKSQIVAVDFDGDGKTDILVYGNGVARMYAFDSNNQIQLLWTSYDENFKRENRFLLGDFNGDGKMDFMMTDESALHFNFFFNTGISFMKEIVSYSVGNLSSKVLNNTQNHFYEHSSIYSADINSDGKTDLIVAKFAVKSTTALFMGIKKGGYIRSVTFYKNKGLRGGAPSFEQIRSQSTISDEVQAINSDYANHQYNPIPVFLNPKQQMAFTIEAFQLAFISNNKVYKYNSRHNSLRDKRLYNISSSDDLSLRINYQNYGVEEKYGEQTDFPHFMNYGGPRIQYPNIEMKTLANTPIVASISSYSGNEKRLTKSFSYAVPVFNTQGIGFLGYRGVVSTNWYNSPQDMIKTIKEFDISKRGVLIKESSALGDRWNNFTTITIPQGEPYDSKYDPVDFQYNATTNFVYNMELLPNKVLKMQNIKENTINIQEGTFKEVTNSFNNYNDIITRTIKYKRRSHIANADDILEKTERFSTKFDYGIQSTPYHASRIVSQTQKSIGEGNGGFASQTFFTYSDKGLVTQLKRKSGDLRIYTGDRDVLEPVSEFEAASTQANLTGLPPFLQPVIGDGKEIIEDNIYDSRGNLIEKKITATDMSPRISKFKYDNTGRFLIEQTDTEGLTHKYKYKTFTGDLIEETNPYGSITSYEYNSLRLPIKVTDYLNNSVATTYTKSNGISVVTNISSQGGGTIDKFDKFGNKVESSVQNAKGVWINSQFKYDAYKQLIASSEPYFGDTPLLWNTKQYDVYGRVVRSVESTDKTSTYTYNKLVTLFDDGLISKKISKNSEGKVLTIEKVGERSGVNYTYFSNGNIKSASYLGSTMTMEQDSWGRKTKLIDPSAGTYTYEYNAMGELIKETTPKGSTEYILNDIGKLITKKITGDHTNSEINYSYDPISKLVQKTQAVINGDNYLYEYAYDEWNRLSKTTETTPWAIFEKMVTFDDLGRVNTEKFKAEAYGKSSEKIIAHTYKNGQHYKITDVLTGVELLAKENTNERGQLTDYLLGNGQTVKNTYDKYGYWIKSSHRKNFFINDQFNNTFDVKRGNLATRNPGGIRLIGVPRPTESFAYDNNDRLTSFTSLEGVQEVQTYDERGRIAENSLGTFRYKSDNVYQLKEIELTDSALEYYQLRPEQHIVYNAFKSPISIEEVGGETVFFDYNASNQRSTMYYGGDKTNKLENPMRRHYSQDGSMEVTYDTTTDSVDFLTYLDGNAYTATVIAKGVTIQPIFYLHRDYLSSITAITNAAGGVVETRAYDPWGNLTKITDGSGNVLSKLTFMDRGYTGHEHLQGVKIIHMNARLYDPVLKRFLSPDNFVQDLGNSDNFNRYGYAYNNPLKFTDQSGEFFWAAVVVGAIIGATMGAASYAAQALITGNWNWGGFAISTFGGAVIGGISGGIASNVCSITLSQVGNSALSSFVTGFMPSIPIKIDSHWTLNLSPSMAFGTGGSAVGLSKGLTYQDHKWTFNITGVGRADGTGNSLGGGFSYTDGNKSYSLGFTAFGGADCQNNWFIGYKNGDFSFKMTNDAFVGGDKFRTAAAEFGIGDYSFGFNLYTTEPDYREYDKTLNPSGEGLDKTYKSPIYDKKDSATTSNKYYTYSSGERVYAGAYVGIKVGNSMQRLGYDGPEVQDLFQNGVHRGIVKGPYFNTNLGSPASIFQQSYTYNPWTLYSR